MAMLFKVKRVWLAALVVGLGCLAASGAQARECTRLAFSVNDYGIEIPRRDSQRLLDEYIKEWTAERGIENYTVGEKDVTCELFIDLILFDEHTCRAEAPVCW